MYVWECINCHHKVCSVQDFHINERLVCVSCGAEMELWSEETEEDVCGDGLGLEPAVI